MNKTPFFIRTLSFLFMPQHSMVEYFLNLGIYPVNDLYPKNRLDARLLEKYNIWNLSWEPLDWDKLSILM